MNYLLKLWVTSFLVVATSYFVVSPAAASTAVDGWKPSGSNVYHNGKVGIGTSSPSLRLHVRGNSAIRDDHGLAKNESLFTIRAYDYQPSLDSNLLVVGSSGASNWEFFKVKGNGQTIAREIVVTSAAAYWPDYVFADDYKLKSLSEVEDYILTHKHLPNIPSAAEIEQAGLSLGEMQRLQLEKIEELTLHLIAQEKRLLELEGKLANLKLDNQIL